MPDEVAAILDHDLAVAVGRRGHLLHRLFFSPPDEQCFVAVQDERVGVVVTVLPLDYHASCAWTVPSTAESLARGRLLGRATSVRSLPSPHEVSVPAIHIGGYFRNGQGGLRYQNFGSLPPHRFECDVRVLLGNDAVFEEIRDRIRAKRRLGEVPVEIFLRRGRRGAPTRIHLAESHRLQG